MISRTRHNRVSGRNRIFAAAATGLAMLISFQIPDVSVAQRSDPFSYSGSVGFTVRGYGVNGIPARQETLIAQSFANASFNLLGLSSGINLTYTTQQSRINQNINRLAFNTSWEWGSLSAGDVNPGYSRYGLRGINVRGGELSLNHGDFVFSMTTGQNRRPVEFNPNLAFAEPAFRRMVYAAKMGYGNESSNFFRLSGAYIHDMQTSIAETDRISPAENLIVSTEGGFHLLDGRLQLMGEVTASALTPDMRNPEIRTSGNQLFPSFVMSERDGSFVDFAGEMQMRLNMEGFRLQAQYARIQPGFESLGLSRTINDQERFGLQPTFILMDNRLRVGLNTSLSRNNLQGQLLSTFYRYQAGTNLQYTVSEHLSLSGAYSFMGNENRPGDGVQDPVRLHNKIITQMIMFSPTYNFESGELAHVVSYSGNLQLMSDRSDAIGAGIRQARNQTVTTNTLSYRLQFPSGFSINSNSNFLYSDGSGTTTRSAGANVGTGFRFFDNSLNTNLSVGWSQNRLSINTGQPMADRVTNQINTSVSANYRLGDASTIRFQLRGLLNNNRTQTISNYQEIQGSLQFNYRF